MELTDCLNRSPPHLHTAGKVARTHCSPKTASFLLFFSSSLHNLLQWAYHPLIYNRLEIFQVFACQTFSNPFFLIVVYCGFKTRLGKLQE